MMMPGVLPTEGRASHPGNPSWDGQGRAFSRDGPVPFLPNLPEGDPWARAFNIRVHSSCHWQGNRAAVKSPDLTRPASDLTRNHQTKRHHEAAELETAGVDS